MSTFHDMEFEFTGTAPPAWEKNDAAERMSFMASAGARETSPPVRSSAPGLSGPFASIAIPCETSSTWPSSSAVIAATRL